MVSPIRDLFCRYFFVILMTISSIIIYLWLDRALPVVTSEQMKKSASQDYALAVNFNFFDLSGGLEYWLYADKMVRYVDNRKIEIINPYLQFFSKGRLNGSVFAKKGKLDVECSAIELFDSVEFMQFPDNKYPSSKIKSNYFKILLSEQIVSSDQHVEITSDKTFTRARGLFYSHKTRNLNLFGNVTGKLDKYDAKIKPKN